MLVIEPMDRAIARGATIFGEILGYGQSNDAIHMTQPSVAGQVAAMQCALRAAGIDLQAVDAINAHGTGTQANDRTETAAIRAVFGRRAEQIPISATKAMHGHLLGAAGALECVLSLLAMQAAVSLPTMHLQQADPECDLDYVANVARLGVEARVMLSNSFAFGGSNAVLVLGAGPDDHTELDQAQEVFNAAQYSNYIFRFPKSSATARSLSNRRSEPGPSKVPNLKRRFTMQQLKDLMSTDVKVISPEMTIGEAARQMSEGDFGMMPVVESDRMIGTISDRDIAIRGVAAGLGAETKVREVMSNGIAWAYEDDSVEKAASIMSDRQVRRLPVVNREKRLVGIVALGDFAVDSSEMKPTVEALKEISKPS